MEKDQDEFKKVMDSFWRYTNKFKRQLRALEFTVFFLIYTVGFPWLLARFYTNSQGIYNSLIDAFGGFIPIVGAAAWLLQTLIVFELDREKFVFQTRFARLDQARAEAILLIHTHLVQSIEGTEAIINHIDRLKVLSEKKKREENKHRNYDKDLKNHAKIFELDVKKYVPLIHRTRQAIKIHGIYLSPKLETKVDNLLEKLQEAVTIAWGEQANDLESYVNDLEKAKKIMKDDLPTVRDEIKREFRDVLGSMLK